MPIRYFTGRPPVVQGLEWNGTNFAEVTAFAANWGFNAVDNGNGTITTSGVVCSGENLAVGAWLIPNVANAQTFAGVQSQYQELQSDGPFEYTITEETTNPMTGYVRKPNTFDELQIQSSTDHADIAALFGESYNPTRFNILGSGFIGVDFFTVILNGMDLGNGGTETLYVNTGGYVRVERRGDGKSIGVTTAMGPLASDPDFIQA